MYVIVRIAPGPTHYVARPGSASSYTRYLQYAQTFGNRESADLHRCPENEGIVSVDDIMQERKR